MDWFTKKKKEDLFPKFIVDADKSLPRVRTKEELIDIYTNLDYYLPKAILNPAHVKNITKDWIAEQNKPVPEDKPDDSVITKLSNYSKRMEQEQKKDFAPKEGDSLLSRAAKDLNNDMLNSPSGFTGMPAFATFKHAEALRNLAARNPEIFRDSPEILSKITNALSKYNKNAWGDDAINYAGKIENFDLVPRIKEILNMK